jgi:hypothetical protein
MKTSKTTIKTNHREESERPAQRRHPQAHCFNKHTFCHVLLVCAHTCSCGCVHASFRARSLYIIGWKDTCKYPCVEDARWKDTCKWLRRRCTYANASARTHERTHVHHPCALTVALSPFGARACSFSLSCITPVVDGRRRCDEMMRETCDRGRMRTET